MTECSEVTICGLQERWLSSNAGTTELCQGKEEEQSKVSLLLSQQGRLEGVKLEGKCPPCISWSSVRKPHKEKATQKHQLRTATQPSLGCMCSEGHSPGNGREKTELPW